VTTAFINRIGTAVPAHDVHAAYLRFVEPSLESEAERKLLARMAARSGIDHRWSSLAPGTSLDCADDEGFYRRDAFPTTDARMRRYDRDGLALARQAVAALALDAAERAALTHLIFISCTGFSAPGIDQRLIDILGLDPSIERTSIGFMGCAAAVNGLKLARHIIRSQPDARVLMLNVEMCSLHFQESNDLEKILSGMLFADGAAATLVTAHPQGLALEGFRAVTLPGSADLIRWDIGDSGFAMHLSGAVPGAIAAALAAEIGRNLPGGLLDGQPPEAFDAWAVHPGGRTVLDAVERGLGLPGAALRRSRDVLRDFGNMSSATILFVLQRILCGSRDGCGQGFGLAFGPGVVAETFRFRFAGPA